MDYKYFDEPEIEVLKNYFTVDTNFVHNFFVHYCNNIANLSFFLEKKMELINSQFIRTGSMYKKELNQTREQFISEIENNEKVRLINEDIPLRCQRDEIINKAYKKIKEIFIVNNPNNIDLIGFIIYKTNKVPSIEQIVEMADELSSFLNKEGENRMFKDYLIQINIPLEVNKLKRNKEVDIDKLYTEEAINNLQRKIYPKEFHEKNIEIDFEEFYNDFRKYIIGGNPSVYEYLFKNRKLQENCPKFRMINNRKVDIARFAKCFNFSINEIKNIFDIEIDSDNFVWGYKDTPFFKLLIKYNPNFQYKK